MKLESQVTSLELSKHLKELGVKQESLFYWQIYQDQKSVVIFGHHDYFNGEQISAFTVAELGELLPEVYFGTQMSTWKCMDIWHCGNDREVPIAGETEADARAKMLAYLLENKPTRHHTEKKS